MGLQARQVFVIATPAKVDVIYNTKCEAEARCPVVLDKTWRRPNSQPPDTAHLAFGALNNLARTLNTELCNHLSANFFTKFKQYLRTSCAERHGLGAAQAALLLCCVLPCYAT